jgi:hypothetical protein
VADMAFWIVVALAVMAAGALLVVVTSYLLLFFALRSHIPQSRRDTPEP